MKRDKGLINFDCSKQARECNGVRGEGGGLLNSEITLYQGLCRKKSTDQYIANLELHEITLSVFNDLF